MVEVHERTGTDLPPAEVVLARSALDLGAGGTGGPLSDAERSLIAVAQQVAPSSDAERQSAAAAIKAGGDPLGSALIQMRSQVERRQMGAFYTPAEIVDPMLAWVLRHGSERLVDAGCGSGRFAAAAVRRHRDLRVVAVDLDPMATLLTRATLAVLRAREPVVLQTDYTRLELPDFTGRTAWVGNPPYVRHHDLSPAAKAWAAATGELLGVRVSGRSGLHMHFFLATALHARPGDIGCFVTSAEWLDVGYGSALRSLLLDGLGGVGLDVLDPTAVPFEGTATTAVVVTFQVGTDSKPLRLRRVADLAALDEVAEGTPVDRGQLHGAGRWTPFLRAPQPGSQTSVALGQIARVHRGVVSGANGFFLLTRERARDLKLDEWCRPVISHAEEVIQAHGEIRDAPTRRLLLDVAPEVDRRRFPHLDAYLRSGEGDGIDVGYITSRRRPWWGLGRIRPAPIVASYMARRPPAFALNPDRLAIMNIAHGIYPTRPMSDDKLAALVERLNHASASYRGRGRTYHGGLEKFEPREMEDLPIPAGFADD